MKGKRRFPGAVRDHSRVLGRLAAPRQSDSVNGILTKSAKLPRRRACGQNHVTAARDKTAAQIAKHFQGCRADLRRPVDAAGAWLSQGVEFALLVEDDFVVLVFIDRQDDRI
jgi:hypothetical protein